MTVTIATVIYGTGYEHYLPGWVDSALAAQSDAVVVSTDRSHWLREGVVELVSEPPTGWRFPVSWFLNEAFENAESEWVWPIGVDDRIRPYALQALTGRDYADVVQVGYRRSDGLVYNPPPLKNFQILENVNNSLFACSPVKRSAWERVGGFPDVAFEDWAMWRRLARADCVFGYSFNVAVDYDWHPGSNATSKYSADPQNTIDALRF